MTEDLELLIRSGNPMISIESTDEERAVKLLREVAPKLNRHFGEWSMTTGLRPINESGKPDKAVTKPGNVLTALTHLCGSELVIAAMFAAFHAREELQDKHILSEFQQTRLIGA